MVSKLPALDRAQYIKLLQLPMSIFYDCSMVVVVYRVTIVAWVVEEIWIYMVIGCVVRTAAGSFLYLKLCTFFRLFQTKEWEATEANPPAYIKQVIYILQFTICFNPNC